MNIKAANNERGFRKTTRAVCILIYSCIANGVTLTVEVHKMSVNFENFMRL